MGNFGTGISRLEILAPGYPAVKFWPPGFPDWKFRPHQNIETGVLHIPSPRNFIFRRNLLVEPTEAAVNIVRITFAVSLGTAKFRGLYICDK